RKSKVVGTEAAQEAADAQRGGEKADTPPQPSPGASGEKSTPHPGPLHSHLPSPLTPLPSDGRGEPGRGGEGAGGGEGDADASGLKAAETDCSTNETIHSRSVQMGSERLGVVAKMD